MRRLILTRLGYPIRLFKLMVLRRATQLVIWSLVHSKRCTIAPEGWGMVLSQTRFAAAGFTTALGTPIAGTNSSSVQFGTS